MEMPDQFFGYNKEAETIEEKMGLSEAGLVCMVAQINRQNIQMACQQSGLDFKIGDWFVSTGAHENTVVHGPFQKMEAAFDYAREKAGAIRMVAKPTFEGF